MRPIQSIYDENSGQFNECELEILLEEFGVKYPDNPLLITTVRKMVEVEESARPDFINIKNAIPPYDEVCEYFEALKGQNNCYEDLTDPNLCQPEQQQHHMSHQGQGNLNHHQNDHQNFNHQQMMANHMNQQNQQQDFFNDHSQQQMSHQQEPSYEQQMHHQE